MEIKYLTRDGNGNDIIKNVKIKEFPVVEREFTCKICGKQCTSGIDSKKITSSKFTDWVYIGDYICTECSKLFSLYFYSYSVENGEIKIFNVREIKENLLRQHATPFKFIITKTGKKHLFYRACENFSDSSFAVQLETETIFTNRERMKRLFDFVECMQTLGVSKAQMESGKLPLQIMLEPFGAKAYTFLRTELRKSREIEIPLYCGQKRQITEEEAKCCIISTLTM